MLKTSYNRIGGKRIWDFGRVVFYHCTSGIRSPFEVWHFDENELATNYEIVDRQRFKELLFLALKGRKDRQAFQVWD